LFFISVGADFCLSNVECLSKFDTVSNRKSSSSVVVMEASSIPEVSGSSLLASLWAFLISFIKLWVQKNCDVHSYHMHTFGAVVVLLGLKPVVWSASVGSIKLFCEPRFFFSQGRTARQDCFLTLWYLFSFCILTLCYDNNSKFINCDRFAKTSQVLGSFMTKSINCHCVMGFISIVADPWRYLKTLRKFRQKSSQIKWFLVV